MINKHYICDIKKKELAYTDIFHYLNIALIIKEKKQDMNRKRFIFQVLTVCMFFVISCTAAYSMTSADDGKGYTRTELLKNGNFESWTTKNIKESGLLGGKTVNVMGLGSPWGTSNVWAKICGITKTNVSLYRDEHPGNGHCVKLYSQIVEAKVLGIINIRVLAAGSLYLGDLEMPVRTVKNPQTKQNSGMPFTKRPKYLVMDYKTNIIKGNRIRQNGMTKGSEVKGQDMADCVLYLQKRWEDAKGNIYARRIATLVKRFDKSCEWTKDASFKIYYGDITHDKFYNSAWGLTKGETTKYARNSKGDMVPIKEVGWGDADETPTHLVLQFASSYDGAYIGSEGNTLWIDNIRLGY